MGSDKIKGKDNFTRHSFSKSLHRLQIITDYYKNHLKIFRIENLSILY